MSTVTLKGNPFQTAGALPEPGSAAPAFAFTGQDLAEISAATFPGRRLVLNIFPSLDTPVCAASVRRFNALAAGLPATTVLCVSADLPFAAKRFCVAEGLENVVTASVFRHPAFGRAFGVEMAEGPLQGLLARAVIVVEPDGRISYVQLVPEIGQEPDYEAVMAFMGREQ